MFCRYTGRPNHRKDSKVQIILNTEDIKQILQDYVRHNFGPLMDLTDLNTYTFAPTATFTRVEEAEDDGAQ